MKMINIFIPMYDAKSLTFGDSLENAVDVGFVAFCWKTCAK